MNLDIYNDQIEKIGTITISDDILNQKFKASLVHQVYVSMKFNKRIKIASTKDRGEVRGGGRKPWAQKHTGRARHGSIRSPIWKGGGVVGGPTKEKNYKKKINKKMRREAFISAFIQKIKDNQVFIFDNLKLEKPRTAYIFNLINNFSKKILKENNFSKIVVWKDRNEIFKKSVANLPKTKGVTGDNLNVKDLLDYKYVFIVKDAFEKLLEKIE